MTEDTENNTKDAILSSPSTLLMGPSGTGKTHAITTLLEAGLEVFFMAAEPNALDTLLLVAKDKGLDTSKLHYVRAYPKAQSFSAMQKMLVEVNRQADTTQLLKIKGYDQRKECKGYSQLVDHLVEFIDERTGESFGSPEEWGNDRVLVTDSLTGIMKSAEQHVKGLRPIISQPEYGVIQNIVEALLSTLCSLDCMFVLTAHLSRQQDEVSGEINTGVLTTGQKLSPKIPKMFSDVILTRKTGAKYYWDTEAVRTEVKHRYLPLAPDLEPSFMPLVKTWRELEAYYAGQ